MEPPPRVRVRTLVPVVLALSLLFAGGAAATESTGAHGVVANASFERGLSGWRGFRSRLSVVGGGPAGRHAVRVSRRRAHRTFSIYRWPRPVSATRAGRFYVASAWVRSRRGKRVCLRLQEVKGQKIVAAAKSCVRAKGRWQRFPKVRYRAAGKGHELGVSILGSGGRRGRSFTVDAIRVLRRSSQAARDEPGARWYSEASPFNQAVPTAAAVDPASPAMEQGLARAVGYTGFAVNVQSWSTPVYFAHSQVLRASVALTAPWAPARALNGVPIPAGAAPDAEADGGMVVIDPERGCEYDFWQARRSAGGSWSASWANAASIGGTGVDQGGLSTRGSGFNLGAGLIRPEELARGEIRHALAVSYRFTKAGGPVPPATHSDGHDTSPAGIPMGARLQLDPSLKLSSLGLKGWQKTIAHALQVYGAFVSETSTGLALFAQNPQTYRSNPYPFAKAPYTFLPKSLVPHLRVLKLGAQFKPTYKLVSTGCASLN
jgi:hypothetical protein